MVSRPVRDVALTIGCFIACSTTLSSAFNLVPSMTASRLGSVASISSFTHREHQWAGQLGSRSMSRKSTIVAVSTRDEGVNVEETASIPQTSVVKSKEDKVRAVQNGAFLIGSIVTIASLVFYYASDHNGALAGPPFKLGVSTFFLGVILQYAETYNKCTYIRFVREGLINPKSIVRRWQRIMYKVDGNLFRFFLPGRSYDVIDGKPVLRSERRKDSE